MTETMIILLLDKVLIKQYYKVRNLRITIKIYRIIGKKKVRENTSNFIFINKKKMKNRL